MPAALTYPGVYIEELPSGVRTITGVATSITAFIGSAPRGPTDEPIRVQSFAEFERAFGGLWAESTLGYAVAQFFLNGGGDALIVRVASPNSPAAAAANGSSGSAAVVAVKATATLQGLSFAAKTAGTAGNDLKAEITAVDIAGAFDLVLTQSGGPTTLSGCTLGPGDSTFVGTLLGAATSEIDLIAPPPASVAIDGPVDFTGGVDTAGPVSGLPFVAANPGKWGDKLEVTVDIPAGGNNVFNITVKDNGSGATEKFLNLSVDPNNKRYFVTVLDQGSSLLRAGPSATPFTMPGASTAQLGSGEDGPAILNNDVLGSPSLKTGLYALEKADLFNLLCIPPLTFDTDIGPGTRTAAAAYCKARRALYVVDPLMVWNGPAAVIGNQNTTGVDGSAFGMARSENAALFFPFILSPDPLQENRLETFAPCGAVAGIMARTDTTRGVWKAPAGLDATIAGASALSVKLTDGENGQLNPIGVNCLRSFPVIGRVVWGARTMRGADQLADQWKYIPVRRLALYIEESLYRGTQWVVFEPNDEPLWSQIRLNIGAFMNTLFRQGAFQGASPKDAYFVKCSRETTTQTDIDNGVVNIIVGFAPLKPAEFVVIQIQQMAGQIET